MSGDVGVAHINPEKFADRSGSRTAAVLAAAAHFVGVVTEQLAHVDPPHGAEAVDVVRVRMTAITDALFPAAPPEATPVVPDAPAAPPKRAGRPAKGRKG